ncbi:MAG: hypothetical protein HY461_00300 [Parcubacteria group bacterium]|nr:hypothetical protein [Parcubacteria group bacterium]
MYNRINQTIVATLLAVFVFIVGGLPPAFGQGKQGVPTDDALPSLVRYEGHNSAGELLFGHKDSKLSGKSPVVGQPITITVESKARGNKAMFKEFSYNFAFTNLDTGGVGSVFSAPVKSADPEMKISVPYTFKTPGRYRLEWVRENSAEKNAYKREFTVIPDPNVSPPPTNREPVITTASVTPSVIGGKDATVTVQATDPDGDALTTRLYAGTPEQRVAESTLLTFTLPTTITAVEQVIEYRVEVDDGHGHIIKWPTRLRLTVKPEPPTPPATNHAPSTLTVTTPPSAVGGQDVPGHCAFIDPDSGDRHTLTVTSSDAAVVSASTAFVVSANVTELVVRLPTKVVATKTECQLGFMVSDDNGGVSETVWVDLEVLPVVEGTKVDPSVRQEPANTGITLVRPNPLKGLLDNGTITAGSSSTPTEETLPDGRVRYTFKDGFSIEMPPPVQVPPAKPGDKDK